MGRDDRQLITSYLEGDEKSLEVLIKRHLNPVYNFIYRRVGNSRDTEDIAQETFIKAWRYLKKFDQQRSFKAWIFSIARNSCVDFLRKKKPTPFSKFANQERGEFFSETLADPALTPAGSSEQKDAGGRLVFAISGFPTAGPRIIIRISAGRAAGLWAIGNGRRWPILSLAAAFSEKSLKSTTPTL